MKFANAILLAASFCLFSCQMGPLQKSGEPTPAERAKLRADIEGSWQKFAAGDFEAALVGFRQYRREHPQTIFETEVQFGEARTLEQLKEFKKAQPIYQEIISQRLATHPQFAAMAMYYQAGVCESLGEETQMLANLEDAQRNIQFLPPEIAQAALPARRAVALFKAGQSELAQKELKKADQGLTQLRAQGLSPEQWARTYFEMGSISTNQLATENFQIHLDSFSSGQIFLLKSIEAGVAPWSNRALEVLQEHYRDFYNLAMSPPVTASLDAGARERMRMDLQARWLGEISRLAAILKQNWMPKEAPRSEQEKDMRRFVVTLQEEISNRLNDPAVLPLTPESQWNQRLKREGTVRSEPRLPEEIRASRVKSPTPVEKSDPNLRGEEKR